jgi:hypothetical protein
MPDALTIGAALLVAGPVIAALCLMDPGFFKVWSMPRLEHLAFVAAHRRAWRMVNLGFVVATVLTGAGLSAVSGTPDLGGGSAAMVVGGTFAYGIAGVLWCVVLAIRDRTTPLLAELVAGGQPTEPAEAVLGAALGGLFGVFVLTMGAAIIAIAAGLATGGAVAAPVAVIAGLIAATAIAAQILTGDTVPAVLYVPTLLLGVALLLGWS